MCAIQKPKSNLVYLSVQKPWQWKADGKGSEQGCSAFILKVTCDFPLKFQAARNISKPSCCQRRQSDIISLQGTASEAAGMVTLKNKYHKFWFPAGNASTSQLDKAGSAHAWWGQVGPKLSTKDPQESALNLCCAEESPGELLPHPQRSLFSR